MTVKQTTYYMFSLMERIQSQLLIFESNAEGLFEEMEGSSRNWQAKKNRGMGQNSEWANMNTAIMRKNINEMDK